MDPITRYLTIITNIGVIVGLAFVAFELKQNNDNLMVTNEWAFATSSIEIHKAVIENPEVAEIIRKIRSEEELSEVESIQYEFLTRNWIETALSTFALYEAGLVDEATVNAYMRTLRIYLEQHPSAMRPFEEELFPENFRKRVFADDA